ncbi:ThiF family adenylyltransferase [Streptomyces sp. NPDC051554]|uniref:ThiF family adenylyltransferase n=1 Tax=Streptomyces sp. NPDC051554 TaxID=3365656 RepID=UPI00379024C3
MARRPVNPPVPGPSLTIPAHLWRKLTAHLFPGDRAEHGAVLLAGWANGPRGLRLLARDLITARDGTDYLPGQYGHRALSATFVRDAALRARDEHSAYIPVHNHGGTATVAFSPTDLASHQRGYPALRQLTSTPVCALVLAEHAAAGDLWLPDGTRTHLSEIVVPGNNLLRLRPRPAPASAPTAGSHYARQELLFGEIGQQAFREMRAAVVGLGGAGTLLTEGLARLGVGHLVLVDDDTVEDSNLPRLAGAEQGDVGRPKTRLAARLARRAQPGIGLTVLDKRVEDPDARQALTQCDWIFLAADGAAARHWTNATVQQYLVPATQVGVKIPVREGVVGQIHAVARLVLPGTGCLRCDGLINPTDLAVDMMNPADRAAAQYVPGVPAASVMPLNMLAVGEALTHFMHAVTCLHDEDLDIAGVVHRPRSRERDMFLSRQDDQCRWCSPCAQLGRGDSQSQLAVR